MSTLKEYLTKPVNNIIDDYSILDITMPFDKFYKQLNHLTGQTSFAHPQRRAKLSNSPRGLITLKSLFNPKMDSLFDGQPDWVHDLDEFLDTYGNWEVIEVDGDNSYNYEAPTESYINIDRITIQNPKISQFESKDIALFSVGTGLDATTSYSDNVIGIFDNDDGDHYQLTAWGVLDYGVVTGSFVSKNQKYFFDFYAQPMTNLISLHIVSNFKDPDNAIERDADELWLDTTDKDEIKDVIEETMGAPISDLKIKFISELSY